MARASDSGSGDPGSILGRVGVFVSLSKRHLLPKKVLVIPRNRWLRLNMTEKLFTGTLNHNQNKKKTKLYLFAATRRRKSLFPVNLSKKAETRLIENPTAVDIRKIMVPSRRQVIVTIVNVPLLFAYCIVTVSSW